MKTIRLTMAQAVVKYLSAQHIKIDDEVQPIFAGVFAIFGHGNVAGMGQALEEQKKSDTYNIIVLGEDISDKYKILGNAQALEHPFYF